MSHPGWMVENTESFRICFVEWFCLLTVRFIGNVMSLKRILLFISLTALISCDNSPKVAGNMSRVSICNTSGYLIRQQLGNNVKTAGQPCSVESKDGFNVQVRSRYQTPINSVVLKYTAKGFVKGSSLTLREIKVHGIDQEFIPFTALGG